MRIEIYERRNEGVFTAFDPIGIECCKGEEMSGGIVYLASGGCVVAECLACEKLWRFHQMQTCGIGPIISATENPNAFDRKKPDDDVQQEPA